MAIERFEQRQTQETIVSKIEKEFTDPKERQVLRLLIGQKAIGGFNGRIFEAIERTTDYNNLYKQGKVTEPLITASLAGQEHGQKLARFMLEEIEATARMLEIDAARFDELYTWLIANDSDI